MKHADRFLIALVIGIVLIVVAALFVVRRQPEPSYRSDDSPEAAVHN